MPAYSPQSGYLKTNDDNPFRLDETRVSGQRLAADFSALVQAFMTSNSGNAAPANHELGTLWFNTQISQLFVCTRKDNSDVIPGIVAVWTPVSATTGGVVFNAESFRFIFPTGTSHSTVSGSVNLTDSTQVSNASGAIFNLAESNAVFRISTNGSGTEHFFVANNTGATTNLLVTTTSGVIAIDAVVNEIDESQRIKMRAGEVWLLRSQPRTVGDVSTNWVATLWKYAPPNLQTTLRPEARALYIRLTNEGEGVLEARPLIQSEIAVDADGNELDANGSIAVMTPTATEQNQRIYFIAPFRILRLENRGFNSLDELSSYSIAAETTFTLPDGSTNTFFVYESCPFNVGVKFDYNVVFGET